MKVVMKVIVKVRLGIEFSQKLHWPTFMSTFIDIVKFSLFFFVFAPVLLPNIFPVRAPAMKYFIFFAAASTYAVLVTTSNSWLSENEESLRLRSYSKLFFFVPKVDEDFDPLPDGFFWNKFLRNCCQTFTF